MSDCTGTFPARLHALREEHHLSQRDVAELIGLSPSNIAMVEKGIRPPPTRDKLLRLIQAIELWPPESDAFLLAAGHDPDRTPEEELHIQRHFTFSDLLVFARIIMEANGRWYDVVRRNLVERGIRYCYFTTREQEFSELKAKLDRDRVGKHTIDTQLECIILPEPLFVASFALYKYESGVYCCGTKPGSSGRAEVFYTIDPSEALRLYSQIVGWRESIHRAQPIVLDAPRRIHPTESVSAFTVR